MPWAAGDMAGAWCRCRLLCVRGSSCVRVRVRLWLFVVALCRVQRSLLRLLLTATHPLRTPRRRAQQPMAQQQQPQTKRRLGEPTPIASATEI
jgi:hypothetical protein